VRESLRKIPTWLWGNKFAKADLKDYGLPWAEAKKNPIEECSVEQANLITSEAAPDTHYVMLDIDMDAALVPSTTPGHHHLYINKTMKWDDYELLLYVLADCGIISQGYYEASVEKKCTALRLPDVKKQPTDKSSDQKDIDALKGEISYLEGQLDSINNDPKPTDYMKIKKDKILKMLTKKREKLLKLQLGHVKKDVKNYKEFSKGGEIPAYHIHATFGDKDTYKQQAEKVLEALKKQQKEKPQ
jgi:hypothetical protein